MNSLQNYRDLVLFYYLGINTYSLILMGMDKKRARKQQWRISEKKLLTLGFLGGALGILLGMKLYRHKTKHKKFTLANPLNLTLHILLMAQILR